MNEENRTDVLLEEINGKFDFIIEAVSTTNDRLTRVEKRLGAVEEKLDDVGPVREVVVDISADIEDHDRRIVRLEKQVA
jgi:hypothetical protein